MEHAAEGTLLAYMDEELDAPARAGVDGHLAVCDVCAAELDALRAASARAGTLLGVLDVSPPMLRARAAIAAERSAPRRVRFGFGSLARAAMLLLALAGAGAAAVPGSPVRRALEATFARVAQLFGAGATPQVVEVEVPESPATAPGETSSIFVAPADGAVRVSLHAPSGAVDVVVKIVDDTRAGVVATTENGGVRFVSGTGRLEVVGLGTGTVEILIPASVRSATVQVGGLTHVYKENVVLRLTGPAGAGQGSEVRFTIGS